MDIFHIYLLKNCNNVCLKRPKINEKEAGVGPFKKHEALNIKNLSFLFFHKILASPNAVVGIYVAQEENVKTYFCQNLFRETCVE